MEWRRGWDLNPRYPLRYVRFRGGSFQPLTHLSSPRCKSFGKYRSSSFIIPCGVCPNRLVPVPPRCLQPRFFQSNIALKDHLYSRSLFQPYIASSAKQDRSKSGNGSDTRPDPRSLESPRSQAANPSTRSRGLGDRSGVPSLLAFVLDLPFLALHILISRPR